MCRSIGWRQYLAVVTAVSGLALSSPMPAVALDTPPSISVGRSTPASGSLTLADVKVIWPGDDPTRITIGNIEIKGSVSAQAFDAGEITLTNVQVDWPAGSHIKLTIPKTTLKSVTGPTATAERLSADFKPGNLPPIMGWLIALKVGALDMPSFKVATAIGATKNDIEYKDVRLADIAGGKIGIFEAAGITQTGLVDGKPLNFSSGALRMEAFDLGAYAVWLDDSLAASASKEKRPLYSSVSVADLHYSDGTDAFEIKRVSGADFKLGPPAAKPSEIAATIAKMSVDPDFADKNMGEFVTFLRSVIGALEFGTIELEGLKSLEANAPAVEIGLMRFEDFAGTRIGEFRIGNLAVDDPSDGTRMRIGSFAIRGLEVIELDALMDLAAKGKGIDDLAMTDYPKLRLAGIALADLDGTFPDTGNVHIKASTLDTPDWVGFIPVTIKMRLEGLSMPVANLKDPKADAVFKEMGLTDLSFSSRIDLAWKEADETLTLAPATLSFDGIGSIDLGTTLGSIPKSIFENPMMAEMGLFGIDFREAHLTLKDGGGFAFIAKNGEREAGKSRAELAANAALAVETGELAKFAAPETIKQVAGAVKAFILDPKSFRFTATATEPFPLGSAFLMSQKDGDAAALFELARKTIRIEARANE